MQSNNASKLRNFFTIICFGFLVALLAFSISLWLTPRYKSTVKLLTLNTDTTIDTYTASKTANYITSILGEIIYSDSFINNVFNSEANLLDELGQGSEQRQKAWSRIVKTTVQENNGIIIINVYGNDKYQTALLASTIGNYLVANHGQYDGAAERVNVKMIDTPSIYETWSIKQIAQDTGLGFLAGLLFGFTLIMIFPGHRLFDFKTQPKKAKAASASYLSTPAASAAAAAAPAKRLPPESRPLVKPAEQLNEEADTVDIDVDYTQKVSNPWLEEYYEENLPERTSHHQ